MIRLLTRWLVARLRAEAAFVVLLAVAGVGAWLYVGCREARAERDRLQHRLAEICARAGSDAGDGCGRHVARSPTSARAPTSSPHARSPTRSPHTTRAPARTRRAPARSPPRRRPLPTR
ncbi:hypothetical protein [Sphingomonas phyllosphaerae]|uniref:hypothetical protein n=1 Tax=Sphingomonas phyllosphaerae TaxID=257003 RepID=UPI00241391C4|nr:hypothetical protein [Sphingomonas phyllosphaerae]